MLKEEFQFLKELAEWDELVLFPVNQDKRPEVKFRSLPDGDKSTLYENAYGVGLATGLRSGGLVVIDVDMKGGKDGLASLKNLPPLPDTFTVRTRSGGYHYYYVTQHTVRNSVEKLGPGLDVRGLGGYVVAPGTPGYEVEADLDIQTLPPEWLDLVRGGQEPLFESSSQSRNTAFSREDIALGLKCKKGKYAASWRAIVKAERFIRVAGGVAGPELGSVNNYLFEMMKWFSEQESWCHISAEAMSELLGPSLSILQIDDEKAGNSIFTMQDLLSMFDRAKQPVLELEGMKKAVKKARESAQAQKKQKQQELDELKEAHDGEMEDLENRILINKNVYYLSDDTGVYTGPYVREEVWAAARERGLPVTAPTKNGTRRLTAADMVEAYGAHVSHITMDMTIQKAVFEDSHLITPTKVRPVIKSRHHEKVHRWLELLGGDRLLDWLAVSLDVGYAAPAVWITGEPGIGKTLLGVGLSQLWGERKGTPIELAFSRFNDNILKCPIILAEEHLPCDFNGQPKLEELKDLISTTSQVIETKGLPTRNVRGAVRVLLSSNNTNMIKGPRDLTLADVDALTQRFIHINHGTETAAPIRNILGSVAIQTDWIDSGALAEHITWLTNNRTVAHGPRLRVPPSAEHLENSLKTQPGGGFYLCRAIYKWIIDYASDAQSWKEQTSDRMRWRESTAAVTAWGLKRKLELDKFSMNDRTVGAGIKRLSKYRKSVKIDGKVRKMSFIDLDIIRAWCHDEGEEWSDIEEFEEAVKVLNQAYG